MTLQKGEILEFAKWCLLKKHVGRSYDWLNIEELYNIYNDERSINTDMDLWKENFLKEKQTTFFLPEVTRVEVINHEASLKYPPGRVYVNMICKDVELQYQDNFKTLKIFIK